MNTYKALEDFTYRDSYWIRQRKFVKKGEQAEIPEKVALRLLELNKIEELGKSKPTPSNNKSFTPQSNKGYTLSDKLGGGWFHILDSEGNQVDKAQGEEKAIAKLKEFNGNI